MSRHLSTSHPEVKEIVEVIRKAGWKIRWTSGGHIFAYSPDGRSTVTISSTPGRNRSMSNTKAILRAAGLQFPSDSHKRATSKQ